MFSKLKNQLPPGGLLAAGLVVLTLLTALSGLWNYNHDLAGQPVAKLSAGTSARGSVAGAAATIPGLAPATNGASGSTTSNSPVKSFSAGASGSHSTTAKGSTAQSGGTAATANPGNSQPAAAPAAQPAAISVALSVNGSGKGLVKLAAGSSQCDVLTQALASGVISSLTMQYYPQYGSEAVYVIDGIGDPGTVRWTYTVNGTPPPYGCSLVTAHNGDSVNWQFN